MSLSKLLAAMRMVLSSPASQVVQPSRNWLLPPPTMVSAFSSSRQVLPAQMTRLPASSSSVRVAATARSKGPVSSPSSCSVVAMS